MAIASLELDMDIFLETLFTHGFHHIVGIVNNYDGWENL